MIREIIMGYCLPEGLGYCNVIAVIAKMKGLVDFQPHTLSTFRFVSE